MTLRPPLLLALLAACATAPAHAPVTAVPTVPPAVPAPRPPVAAKQPHVRELHGDRFVEDYFWLRNKGTPEVEAYLNAEEAYAQQALAPLRPLQETLYQEIVSHVPGDDATPPVKDGAYERWRKVLDGKQYPLFLRRRLPAGPEEVVLDVNQLAAGKQFMSVGGLDFSDDDRRLAYLTDETGFRQYTLQVKDLATGALLPDRAERVDGVAWAADGQTLFYVVENDAKRAYRAYRHRLGTPASADVLVYEEKDERFDLSVERSSSKRYVVLQSHSKLTSEVRLLDARAPTAAPVVVEPRVEGREYEVDDDGTQLFVRSNDLGHHFRLATAPLATPGRAHWKDLVPHEEAVMLSGFQVFAGRVVLQVRRAGQAELEVLDLRSRRREAIVLPDAVHTVFLDQNPELKAPTVRFTYQSFTTPQSWYTWDFTTRSLSLLKETPVPGGFDRSRYQTERLEAVAADGTHVPISLVARKGVPRDGSAPLFLQAYGSYGSSYPVAFNPAALSLLDRGVVLAVAHLRGGGELGKTWHEQGRMAKKMNTFTDFIACAERLVADGYTSSKRLVIQGGSAGGLLMGAVTNLKPSLFQAVVADVPFVDVLNTMNDPSLPLTVGEYEEWGNPGKAEEYRWMKAYSPYDNLEAKAYPALLVRSSYNDSQVMYFEPAKYVARLRALKTDDRPLLFHIRMEPAGHGGKSGRYERYREQAELYAFVLWQQGLGPVPAR